MKNSTAQSINLEGGRVYHVHSMAQQTAEEFLRAQAVEQLLQFTPFVFEQGDRETVEKVRTLLAVEYAVPTLFFIASNRPYTHDSQALLLKVLENLHDNTTVVLHTRSKEDILETIQSRSIALSFNSVAENSELKKISLQFLQSKPEKRLVQIAQFIAGDDETVEHSVDDLVKEIESYISSEAASAIKPDLVYIAGGVLKLFHEARNLRTIPPKTLFEYLAVSLPVL